MWFVPNTVIGAEGTAHPQENSAIYASFKLGNSISRQKLYNYEHFFFLKSKSGLPVSPTSKPCLKDYAHNLTKYEI